MTADLSALLDRLEAAAAAATPGPWHVMRSADERRAYALAHTRLVTDSAGCSVADAALIVAAVTALPTLIAELRAHQAAVQAVRELADRLDGYVALRGRPAGGSFDNGVNLAQTDAAISIRAAVAALDPKGTDHA